MSISIRPGVIDSTPLVYYDLATAITGLLRFQRQRTMRSGDNRSLGRQVQALAMCKTRIHHEDDDGEDFPELPCVAPLAKL